MRYKNTRRGRYLPENNRFRNLPILLAVMLSLASSIPGQGGTLDPTFGNAGARIVSTPTYPLGSRETDSVMQADGKIVSLMSATSPGTTIRNSIVRLNPDGSIDPSFGNNGFRDVVWTAPYGIATTISIQIVQTPFGPEERFVIAGNAETSQNTSYFRVERYTNSGALDPTFGVNGVASLNLTVSLSTSTVQPFDQKILIGGGETILRLNANGTLDSTFGAGGVLRTKIGVGYKDLDVLPDGRILATGYVSQGKTGVAVARFNSNGSLDDGGRNDATRGDSFGVGGKSVVTIGHSDFGLATAVDPANGSLYVAGESQIGGTRVQNYDAIIIRLNALGQHDKSFGTNGVAVLNVANLQDEFEGVVLFDNQIIVVGEGRSGGDTADYLVARYNLNGTLDPTFGGGGWLLYNFLNDYDHASNVFIQADPFCGGCPKLIVTGSVYTGNPALSPSYAGILRFLL